MTAILYAKIGGIVAAVALLFGLGYHFGGLSAKTAGEAQHAAQLSAVASAYQNQVLAREASEATLKRVQDAYDAIQSTPDPVSAGLATRVLYHACPTGGGVVPQAGAVASRAPAAAAQPSGDPGLGERLQAVLDACTADARQMNAMLELAPR